MKIGYEEKLERDNRSSVFLMPSFCDKGIAFIFILLMFLGLIATLLEAYVIKSKKNLRRLDRGFLWTCRLFLVLIVAWLFVSAYLCPSDPSSQNMLTPYYR